MKSIALLLAVTLSAVAADQPNILLLFADDLGRYASAYAEPEQPSPNDIIKTPVFDRIAEQGVRFDNAFVSVPSCTPCRGSLYTGRHFFRNASASQLHNRWAKGAPNPFDKVIGMPNTLAKVGYHIGWSHKWHIPERLIGGKQNHYGKAGNRISTYSQQVTKKPDAKQDILNAVRENFQSFLEDREGDQPFFYSFNPTNTHRTWIQGSGKKLWGLDPDELEGKLPPFLPDTPIVREDFADYLGEAMAFDAACGVIIDELKTRGEFENTIICITGDHGAPGFPRGKCNVHDFGSRVLLSMSWPGHIEAGKEIDVPVSLIDLAPTFLAAAGTESPDDPNGENLLPALAKDGSEKMLRQWVLVGREVHVGSARDGYLPYPVRALRTPDHLYVRNFKPERWPMGSPKAADADKIDFDQFVKNTRAGYADLDASPTKAWMVEFRDDDEVSPLLAYAWEKRPGEELYDLKRDPFQMKNLADDPDYSKIKAQLKDQLMTELKRNDDPRLNDAFDRPPYVDKTRK